MRVHVRGLLECVGEDPDRPGLLDTPDRFAKAWLYLTQGYRQSPRDIIGNAIWDDEGHNHHGMVIERDIEIASLCEHHLVPFLGKVSVLLHHTPELSLPQLFSPPSSFF